MKRPRLPGLAMSGVLIPGMAQAHDFASGTGFYDGMLEGAGVVTSYPPVLIPLIALGLLVGLWRVDGMRRVLPVFLMGQVAGIALGAMGGGWLALAPMLAGIASAVLAALAPGRGALATIGLAALTGITAMGAALEGHALFSVPVSVLLGLVAAITLAVSFTAGLVRSTRPFFDSLPWVVILWRTAASWAAAILVLYIAFTLKGGV